jgi:uncharacterized protein (TIGR03085 family)
VPGVRTFTNLNEYVIHHEDVRRANGRGPRTDVPDVQDAVWKLVKGAARLSTRKLGDIGLDLVRPGGDRVTARKGSPTAALTGDPVELGLYLAGRKSAAAVDLAGDPAAITALQDADFGL